jgi:hypothetical protein
LKGICGRTEKSLGDDLSFTAIALALVDLILKKKEQDRLPVLGGLCEITMDFAESVGLAFSIGPATKQPRDISGVLASWPGRVGVLTHINAQSIHTLFVKSG